MDKRKRAKTTEIILLSVFGAIWTLGLTLAILGMVAYNLPSLTEGNPLYSAQKNFAKFLGIGGVVDFRILGAVILLVAMIVIIVVLFHYANKYDQIKAKQARREERRKKLLADVDNDQKSESEPTSR